MKLLLLTTLSLISLVSFSQEKVTVGILPFTYVSGSASFQDVNTVSESVVTAFVKTKRFNIVDRSKIDAVAAEKQLQKSEDFIDGTAAEQGKSMGAEFLVSGHVTSATKTAEQKSRTKADGSTEYYIDYNAKIVFTCKIIDVATGQVVNSETFQNQAGGLLGITLANSVDEAFSSSLKSLSKSIDKWVSKNFPLIFDFVEVQSKDKKGWPAEVLVAAGSDAGMAKGDKVAIVEVTKIQVGGVTKERNKEIGYAKVIKVEDGSFSICAVTDGADVLSEKLAAGSVIKFKTIDK